MSKAGMKYFVTQKLSWNNINRFPHSSFWWEGIDGTRVLTHFPPSNTYTSLATAGDIIRSERDYKDVDRSGNALLLYGHGDGGGGPTEEMLSRLEHMRAIPGLPHVRFGAPMDFFRSLERESAEFLHWKGELYFELHRGTYTSQARTKYYNRRCETLLREAEMLSVISGLVSRALITLYPKTEMERLWKNVLLNQFHDVLPGSSIGAVYEDAARLYEDAEYHASKIRDDAMNALFGNKVGNHNPNSKLVRNGGDSDYKIKEDDTLTLISRLLDGSKNNYMTKRRVEPSKDEKGIVFFNTTPYERDEVLIVPYDGDENSPQRGVLAVAGIKGHSMASFSRAQVPMNLPDETIVKISKAESHYIMENKFIRVHFNGTGHITSVYDKEVGREVIPWGENANRFMIYEDLPYYWDAWDVELHHLEKGWCVSDGQNVELSIGMEGPLLASLLRVIPISSVSTITQVISLSCLSKRIEFNCRIEWHEKHRLLKVDFPVAIKADRATFECPYGIITRPTNMNTSWDVARFEVCGHRFADLSEPDYGVAILNDCKYGYSVRDSLIQLSLLRAPTMPDEQCDMGTHLMRFALFPHHSNVTFGGVIKEAVKFNTPLLWTSASPELYDLRWLDSSILRFEWWRPHYLGHELSVPLAIEVFKLAEDGSGDVIIRAYEPHGDRGVAILSAHELIKISALRRCDLLERDEDKEHISIDDTKTGTWLIPFKPYEILSLRAHIELSPEATPLPVSSSFEDIIA